MCGGCHGPSVAVAPSISARACKMVARMGIRELAQSLRHYQHAAPTAQPPASERTRVIATASVLTTTALRGVKSHEEEHAGLHPDRTDDRGRDHRHPGR